jgi:exonuclease SbcC
VFQSLAEPPTLADPVPLQNRVAQLRMLQDSIRKSSRYQEAFQSLAEPPSLADATVLQSRLSAIRRQQRSVLHLAKLQSALSSIPQPPKPTDVESISSLAKSVVNLQIAHESVDQMKKDLAAVAKEVSKSKSAIHDWAADNPSCPTCGSEVNAETILSGGGHQHG